MQRETLILATSTFMAAAGAIATLVLGSSPSLAAGDPAAGQRVFAQCAGCHATAPNVIAYLGTLKGP